MRLEILTPSTAIELDVDGVTAVDASGSFGIMARHTDFVSALVPCILAYRKGEDGGYVVVDGGVMRVEAGRVTVAARRAVKGEDVAQLKELLMREFAVMEEKEATFMELLGNMEKLLIDRMVKFERGG